MPELLNLISTSRENTCSKNCFVPQNLTLAFKFVLNKDFNFYIVSLILTAVGHSLLSSDSESQTRKKEKELTNSASLFVVSFKQGSQIGLAIMRQSHQLFMGSKWTMDSLASRQVLGLL